MRVPARFACIYAQISLALSKGVQLIRPGIAQAALKGNFFQPLDAFVEILSEIGAIKLAVGDNVQSGFGHVGNRHIDRVAQGFVDVGRTNFALGNCIAHHLDPTEDALTANRLGGQQRQISQS